MAETLVPIEAFDTMMCRVCSCEQFKLLGLFEGDEALALVAECDECGHREQVIVTGDEFDA